MHEDQQLLIGCGDPLARAYLRALLDQEAKSRPIIEVSSFSALVESLRENDGIMLAILDIDLPGLSADVGLRYLASHYATRFAVIFSSLSTEIVAQLIHDGVAACVPKDLDETSMVRAFKTVLNGSIYVPFSLGSADDDERPEEESQADFLDQELTGRQSEVLRLVAMGHSNRQIAEILNIAEGTVKVHVNAMFRILGVHNRVNAAAMLQRHSELSAAAARPKR